MSIATEISRLQTAKASIKTAIEGKGVAVPSSATLETYNEYISAITTGDRYEMLEYIESDGSFYIPTNIYMTSSMWIDYKFQLTSYPGGTNQHIFSGVSYRAAQIRNDGGFWIRRGDKTAGGANTLSITTSPFVIGQDKYVVAFKGSDNILVNGSSVGSIVPDTGLTDTVASYFFSYNMMTDAQTYAARGLLYYFKIGTGNTTLYNFIPAKRNSDNNVGLYDTVNEVFYPSSPTA